MYEIAIGEIRDELKGEGWKDIAGGTSEGVLKNEIIRRECRMGMLYSAKDELEDMVQLDMNRFAWRGRKKQIRKLFKRKGYKDDLSILNPRKLYGIVYIDG